MSKRQVKLIEPSDYDTAIELGEYAFQYTLSDLAREKKKKEMQEHQLVLGSFVGTKLAAKLHILPLKLLMGETSIDFGGVASVATWPELRRSGHVSQLLQHAFKKMKENGQVLSMLHPFLIEFYRAFGYEVSHYTYKYKLKPNDIPFQSLAGYCQRVSLKTHQTDLMRLYRQVAQQYGLMIDREDWWWENRVISEKDTIILYYDENDQPTGYLIASVKKPTLQVNEFVYQSNTACQGLLQWIRNHDSMVEEVDLHVTPNQTLAFYLKNPRIPLTNEAYFMSRIVDFAGFMQQYPYITTTKKVHIQIELEDAHASWNEGDWFVTFENGICTSAKKIEEPVENNADIVVRGNINMISAWLLGSESLVNLQRFNKLEVEENRISWEEISDIKDPYLLDFF